MLILDWFLPSSFIFGECWMDTFRWLWKQKMFQNSVKHTKPSAFSFEYYKEYFDVDTNQVRQRLVGGIIPCKKYSLTASLRPTPDLYGPFWIVITLIFAFAFSGSVHDYLVSKDATALATFNFGRVTTSAIVLFVYWFILPVSLISIIWFQRRKQNADANAIGSEPELKYHAIFSEIMSIYGYSLTVFVPATMLLCIPIPFFQWILVGIASMISLCVLGLATWSTFKQIGKQPAVGLLVLIVVAHITMTIILSVIFFSQPQTVQAKSPLAAFEKPDNQEVHIGVKPHSEQQNSPPKPKAIESREPRPPPPAATS